MRQGIRITVALLMSLWLEQSFGQTRNYVVITHASSTTLSLNASELRRIFAARQQVWTSGGRITVVMRTKNSNEHALFCREYLNVFPYQLERIWNQLVYSGQAEAPIYSSSDDAIVELVANTPGAIGYVASSLLLPDSVKTIEIKEDMR